MSSLTTSNAPGLAFLEGGSKKLFIGGAWVDADAGRTMPSINPSTGQVLTNVADATPGDVDRAVAAARAAFEIYHRRRHGDARGQESASRRGRCARHVAVLRGLGHQDHR